MLVSFGRFKNQILQHNFFKFNYRSKELEVVVKEFDKMSVKGICEPEFPTTVRNRIFLVSFKLSKAVNSDQSQRLWP